LRSEAEQTRRAAEGASRRPSFRVPLTEGRRRYAAGGSKAPRATKPGGAYEGQILRAFRFAALCRILRLLTKADDVRNR
jgi:hypothetical protein